LSTTRAIDKLLAMMKDESLQYSINLALAIEGAMEENERHILPFHKLILLPASF
jgi:hypothetical protein